VIFPQLGNGHPQGKSTDEDQVCGHTVGGTVAADRTGAVSTAAGAMAILSYRFEVAMFSSDHVGARSSGAQVIPLTNSAGDIINAIRKKHECDVCSQRPAKRFPVLDKQRIATRAEWCKVDRHDLRAVQSVGIGNGPVVAASIRQLQVEEPNTLSAKNAQIAG
jgi:hypothetical protein